MDIYIEREFLDDFYINWSDDFASNSKEQIILYNMLTKYPETKWFYEGKINSITDFEEVKLNNPIFAAKSNYYVPIPVESIKETLFNSNFEQNIVLTYNTKEWFKDAENKGALCLSFDDYELKIKEYIEKHTFKIDLSQKLENYNMLKPALPFNKVYLNDGYILNDGSQQKIKKNLIPLLEAILSNTELNVDIYIMTKEILRNQPKEEVQREANSRIQLLNRQFANYNCRFSIINNDIPTKTDFNFHDRNISFNFHIIDSGKGFNLFPYKNSNSQIISETIFDLYTYKRIKNLNKEFKNYLKKIKDFDSPYQFVYEGRINC